MGTKNKTDKEYGLYLYTYIWLLGSILSQSESSVSDSGYHGHLH